jgi:hypothetical protein
MKSAVPSLHPDVATYSRKAFSLKSDIENIEKVLSVGSWEAAVFYATRTLDSLVSDAVSKAGFPPEKEVFFNLEILKQYNIMPPPILCWAHALRDLGNDVRHVRRCASQKDGEWASAFLERILCWFFTRFALGSRLPSVTNNSSCAVFPNAQRFRGFLINLEHSQLLLRVANRVLCGKWRALLDSPVLAALLADQLLAIEETPVAEQILRVALANYATQDRPTRLVQLLGLSLSRSKKTEKLMEAIEVLESMTSNKGGMETLGICGGAFKRLWNADRKNRTHLESAYQRYFQGWLNSSLRNTYVGVNAATTAFWLGDRQQAHLLAHAVLRILEERKRRLVRARLIRLNLWDAVTIAECRLLLGEIASARETYEDAFHAYPAQTGDHGIARTQARGLVRALGLSEAAAARFLDISHLPQPVRRPQRVLRLGITGHRQIMDKGAAARGLAEAFRRFSMKNGKKAQFVLLTALAEGADRLAAQVLLEQFPDSSIEVLLPLEAEDYMEDFKTPESRQEFQELLDQADVIVPPRSPDLSHPEISPRQAAYLAAGEATVDRSDGLIAIWDGNPARGLGGTGHIVQYARAAKKAVFWIPTDGSEPRFLTENVAQSSKSPGT